MKIGDKECKCPRCGCILDNIKPKAAKNKSSGFIFCPNCGSMSSNNISACQYCGYKI
jgi:Zn finger protein HypA/HybF involved in hydrogenase expression